MTATKSIMDEILGLEPMSSLEDKKIDVSNKLNALMVFCGFRQKDLAHLRNWKKSYVSKILSGDQNLTIKTILEFSEILGYDFDLVFFEKNTSISIRQPWNQENLSHSMVESILTKMPILTTIENNLLNSLADHYFSDSLSYVRNRPFEKDVIDSTTNSYTTLPSLYDFIEKPTQETQHE